MKQIVIALGVAAMPSHLLANDQCATSPVFFCEIKNTGKIVQVCEANGDIHYRFGRVGREAELEITVKRSAAIVTPWNGIGSDYWSSIEIPNGQWSYRLSVSYERGTEDPKTIGSVTVLKKGNDIKTFECLGTTIKERIETLAD